VDTNFQPIFSSLFIIINLLKPIIYRRFPPILVAFHKLIRAGLKPALTDCRTSADLRPWKP